MRALVDDDFRWLSPYLLMLSDVDDSVRAELEHVNRRALAMFHPWRLSSRLVAAEFVHLARVGAAFRRAHAHTASAQR